MLACDMFDAFTTHVGRVYDITDTDCWAQHDNIHSPVFVTFEHQFLTKRTSTQVKNCCGHYFVYSVSINRACDASLVPFSFKCSAENRHQRTLLEQQLHIHIPLTQPGKVKQGHY